MLVAFLLDLLKGREKGLHASFFLLPGVIRGPGAFALDRTEDDFTCLLGSVFLNVFPQFIS